MARSNKPIRCDRPQNSGDVEMKWGSDVIAEILRRLDLEYVALNPGASYRGLHDSIVNYLGNENPEMLLVLHEEHAVAIAHGYAKVTGKPMAVLLHSNVGLMHAVMAIYNAWCDRVPMILLGATGAVDAARRRPWIEWIHTSKDQGALIRNFTKWDDQPASVPATIESLLRASILTRTPPSGPVYVCFDVSLQEDALQGEVRFPEVGRFQPGARPLPPDGAVREAAALLDAARRPLILCGRVSRQQTDWDRRVGLAERLDARVLSDLKAGSSFPTGHILHSGSPAQYLSPARARLIREADAILSLDWTDLAGTFEQAGGSRSANAKVIHCSVDAYVHNGWSMDYQGLPAVDVPVLAEPDLAVAALLDALGSKPGKSPRWERAEDHTAAAKLQSADSAIDLRSLARAFEVARGSRSITLIRLPLGWPDEETAFREPLDCLGYDGGGGIGSGPGMAVGAALALRGTGRLPVAILGDGDYLMGVNALWSAAHYQLPLLIVVNNNRSYFNDERHQEIVARQRHRPVENRWIGQRIDGPAVDICAMARAQGFDGEGPVADRADLGNALERGFKAVENGRAYVIDVHTRGGYAE